MALDSLQYFFQRIPRLNYVSPPICEMEFSSSAFPTIILNPHARRVGPTGLEFFVQDGRIFLRWNNYPGAICFSIYKAVDELDPFGDYHLVAECVQSPTNIDVFGPGTYRITAITVEGETTFSDTVTVTEGAGGAVVTVVATNPNTGFDDVPGVFRISRTGFTIQPVSVSYTLAGTAVNGVNYEFIPNFIVIPAGQSFADVFIVALELAEAEETDVVLTIVPSITLDYAVGSPNFDEVIIAAQGCPAETGNPVPEDLILPENTPIATITPDPFIATHTDNFEASSLEGEYTLTYTSGAYKEDDNPHPGEWKFNGYEAIWDSGGGGLNYTDYFSPTSQAAVEAQVPTPFSIDFFHTGGFIAIKFTRFGVATNPTAGSPNPTFSLTRTGTLIPQPTQLRIVDIATVESTFDGCTVCEASSGDVWDGTIPDRQFWSPGSLGYESTSGTTFANRRFRFASVDYITNHPTSVGGRGFRVEIYCKLDGFNSNILQWRGLKGVGDTPVGRYYRDPNFVTCSELGNTDGPDCLELEEY